MLISILGTILVVALVINICSLILIILASLSADWLVVTFWGSLGMFILVAAAMIICAIWGIGGGAYA